MKKTAFLLTVILLLAVNSVALADSSDWQSKTFDFARIKTVLILDPFINPDVKYPFAQQKIDDLFVAELAKSGIKFVTMGQLEKAILADSGVSLPALAAKDRNLYLAVLRENLPKYVQAVFRFDVKDLGWTKEYVPPTPVPITTTETSNISGTVNQRNNYAGTITTQRTQYEYVGGGNVKFEHAAATAVLYDTDGKMIWGYSDTRSREMPMLGGADGPESMMGRIIRATLDKIPVPKPPK
jgi:hypothetical protein